VDIEENQNDFFKIQILRLKNIEVHSVLPKFFLFTSTGRIGSDLKESSTKAAEAIKVFEERFLEKTGNHWILREERQKIPGKFYPSEMAFYFGFSIEQWRANHIQLAGYRKQM
jgi:hypothetical protein